jgi:hypothetical protein
MVMISNMRLGSFIGVELLFQFFLIHDGPAGSVPVGDLILAFVGVVSKFKAALAADYP